MALRSWLSTTLARIYPGSAPARRGLLAIDAALNEQFSFQVALRMEAGPLQDVRVEASAPGGWSVRVRRVGYVPVRHHGTSVQWCADDVEGIVQIPGFVPDPLFDEDVVKLIEHETHAFWITVQPGAKASPGRHDVMVTIAPEKGKAVRHKVAVRLHDVVLEPRRDFNVIHWFYVDSLIDWYKTDLFDQRLWQILPAYMRNVLGHGGDTVYVPTFTPPLDGVKRPTQLLAVKRTGPDSYHFDWRDVRRYVRMARQCGITHFEWCHPFTQWGAQYASRVYEGQGVGERLLWSPETEAVSKTYRAFLTQYLRELHHFTTREGVFDSSFFHVSDEPHKPEHRENYRKARAVLAEIAPWMKVIDALSDIEFGRQGLTDLPISNIRTAPDFVAENIPCGCYYACGPRGKYLARLLDTPLAKIAMHGMLFYRWPFKAFLHWGYNYWYQWRTRQLIDPYMVADGGSWPTLPSGDPFVVYPGAQGPVDSLRWEVFAESLQDYRLLQTLGVDRNHKLLSPLRSFEDFPKTPQWRLAVRAKLLGGKS